MCSNNMIQITGFCYLFLQVCPATFQNLNTIDKEDVILQSLFLNIQCVKGYPDGRGKHIASALDSGATPSRVIVLCSWARHCNLSLLPRIPGYRRTVNETKQNSEGEGNSEKDWLPIQGGER